MKPWVGRVLWMVAAWAVPMLLAWASGTLGQVVLRPELEVRVAAVGATAEARAAAADKASEQDRRARRAVELAVMRRLVSYDAVDREPDRRKREARAAEARTTFSSQCAPYPATGECAGMSLEAAAAYALDAASKARL